jgi:ribosomal protein S18 acetylase RimI-like enzyme
MPPFLIRSVKPEDGDWVSRVMVAEWGAEIVVVHGEIFHPASVPGFAAFIEAEPLGLLTYKITNNDCEIITLNSWRENIGVGTALVNATWRIADQSGCIRLLVVTTNNNLLALQFYKNRGFSISSIRENAIFESRKLKPQIPLVDNEGRPIRDEIELAINVKMQNSDPN